VRVADLMSRDVHTISPDLAAGAARHEMRRRNVRHLVVVKDGHLAGVISDHDLRSDRAVMSDLDPTVDDLSTGRVVVASPEMSITRAAALLRAHRIDCLPVVDGKRLVGIITTSDLLDYLAGRSHPAASS